MPTPVTDPAGFAVRPQASSSPLPAGRPQTLYVLLRACRPQTLYLLLRACRPQTLYSLLRACRPQQWIKALFVLAPVFFAGKVLAAAVMLPALAMTAAFILGASAVYLFNDILDRDRDAAHPEKCRRPIASGALPLPLALAAAAVMAGAALAVAAWLSPAALLILVCYGAVNLAYSLRLKHVVIVDVFCIALGFVLRVAAGAAAGGVTPSGWIMVATFLLALFLALAKRRAEIVTLDATAAAAAEHRPVLSQYSRELADQLMAVITPMTGLVYLLYTMDPDTITRFHSRLLYATGLFVMFGLCRYLFLVHHHRLGGAPSELVVRDPGLIAAVLGWVAAFGLIIYAPLPF